MIELSHNIELSPLSTKGTVLLPLFTQSTVIFPHYAQYIILFPLHTEDAVFTSTLYP